MRNWIVALCCLGSLWSWAQTPPQQTPTQQTPPTKKERRILEIQTSPLTPSKAAFYSAIVPGLGQIYTRKAWKLPFVYAAIGGSVYGYIFNNNDMDRYRTAYKRRLAGYADDEFAELIPDTEKLLLGMDFHQRYRDMSFLFILGTYMLNILDANVGAHLLQFNISDQLSFEPLLQPDLWTNQMGVGVRIAAKF